VSTRTKRTTLGDERRTAIEVMPSSHQRLKPPKWYKRNVTAINIDAAIKHPAIVLLARTGTSNPQVSPGMALLAKSTLPFFIATNLRRIFRWKLSLATSPSKSSPIPVNQTTQEGFGSPTALGIGAVLPNTPAMSIRFLSSHDGKDNSSRFPQPRRQWVSLRV
jgi:hypothetical protein